MKYRAVFFDFGGTLMSLDRDARAYRIGRMGVK
jgi:FMN phosphatase YigB (HAD superfamily)